MGFTPKHFINVVSLGAPLLVGLIAEFFMYAADSAMVGRLGTVYLAVTHILSMTFALVRTMIAGFAEGGSILIGNHLGIGNRDIAVRYAYRQS